MNAAPPESHSHPRRWLILGVLVVSLLVVVLDNSILNIALKTIADPKVGLGASQSDLEWSINSYTLVFAGLLFTWGILGDRLGRRRILLIGMVLFGLASLACAYAQTPGQLIATRALMAIGGAAVLPNTLSIITNVFDARERPKAIGVWAGSVGLAIAIGPITGGLLLQHFWWGSVFLINVPIVVIGVVAMALIVPESRTPRPGRLDAVGVPLSIVGLVLLVYGIIKGGQLGHWGAPEVWATALGGVAVLAVFVWHERRSTHPTLDVELFRDPRFSAAVGVVGLAFFAMMGVTFFMAFYLQIARGYSPLQSGLLLLPLAVAQLVIAPRSAALVRKHGAKTVCTVGMAICALSFASYLAINATSSLWVLEISFFLLGSGIALVMPPATASVMQVVPREKAGQGSAVNNTVRQVGGALGVAILGALMSSVYRGRVADHLGVLPAGMRHTAAESIEATYAAASNYSQQAHLAPLAQRQLFGQLAAPARDAFISSMHAAAIGSAIVAALAAVVTAVWMPGRENIPQAQQGEREQIPATVRR